MKTEPQLLEEKQAPTRLCIKKPVGRPPVESRQNRLRLFIISRGRREHIGALGRPIAGHILPTHANCLHCARIEHFLGRSPIGAHRLSGDEDQKIRRFIIN